MGLSTSENKWQDNDLQFARLIAECSAEGVFTKEAIHKLCSAMDLAENDIYELIQRATGEFDKIKSKL